MADIQFLAHSAQKKLDNGDAVSEVDAISKAIRGVGITNQSDCKQLMRKVGRQFALNKRDGQRVARRSA